MSFNCIGRIEAFVNNRMVLKGSNSINSLLQTYLQNTSKSNQSGKYLGANGFMVDGLTPNNKDGIMLMVGGGSVYLATTTTRESDISHYEKYIKGVHTALSTETIIGLFLGNDFNPGGPAFNTGFAQFVLGTSLTLSINDTFTVHWHLTISNGR